jgi:hypothetical protein
VRLVHFREVVDVDCPKAMARIERMLKSLDSYREVSGPRPSATGDGSGSAGPVTRQVDEAAPAASAAATAGAPADAARPPEPAPPAGGAS